MQLNDEMQISSPCITEIHKVSEQLFSELLKSDFFPEQYPDLSKKSQPEGSDSINLIYDIKNSDFGYIPCVSNPLL